MHRLIVAAALLVPLVSLAPAQGLPPSTAGCTTYFFVPSAGTPAANNHVHLDVSCLTTVLLAQLAAVPGQLVVPFVPPGTGGEPIAAAPQPPPVGISVASEIHIIDAGSTNLPVTLAHPPLAGTLLLFKNSYFMAAARDYTVDGITGAISFLARQHLFAGDVVVANYQWRGP